MNPQRNALAQRRFQVSLAISVLLHLFALFYHLIHLPNKKNDVPLEPRPREAERPRINAMLVPPRNRGEEVPPAKPQPPAPPPAQKRKPEPPAKVLAVPPLPNAPATWMRNERQEIEKFLEEEARKRRPPAQPPTGQQLAQQALILARRVPRQVEEDDSDQTSKTNSSGKALEPLVLEMYIASFIQKLNRGAAFVQKVPRVRGQHMGEVRIVLNSDGSLRNYAVINPGDQQAEISFIKSVIEVSAPFSAFPPDMKEMMNTLTIPICISPRFAGNGGKVFSRSGTKECAA